jgi:hypothetical protein
MTEIVDKQSDVEDRLEKLRGQLQFKERAREIVILESEILKELSK